MIEEGSYAAQLVQVKTKSGPLWAQFGVSKDGNTTYVVLTFKIRGGSFDGQAIQWTGFFTEKMGKDMLTGSDRAMQNLALVGFKGDDIDTFADQNPPPHGQVEIVTEIERSEKYAPRARVKYINPLGGQLAIDENFTAKRTDLKAISDRMRAAKIAKANAPKFDPNGPPDDDNVRF